MISSHSGSNIPSYLRLMDVFKSTITVEASHLDELAHVNNVVYLQWVQEIAKAHWLAKTDAQINSQYFWVVRSHHIEYKKQAFSGDDLEVKTYVQNYKGPFSERVVEFLKNGELIVEARSNWCLIETESQKPKRVPEELKDLFK